MIKYICDKCNKEIIDQKSYYNWTFDNQSSCCLKLMLCKNCNDEMKNLIDNFTNPRNESLSRRPDIIDENFKIWFFKNCNGFSDIERDIAYAAWNESKQLYQYKGESNE